MTAATNQADVQARELIGTILAESPLKAAGFIVTIYGDVVEPRGGVAWIGNLIETCADVGISETLVRTAVSRLVASGQLLGEREGRRSYYRLSQSAGREFFAAAMALFEPPEDHGWQFVHMTGLSADEQMQALQRAGFARLGPRLAVGPAGPLPATIAGTVFRAETASGQKALAAFVADYWDLAPHAAAYRQFLVQFEPIARVLESDAPALKTSLAVRLLLTHRFRSVLLHDPRLPLPALPKDWPGQDARRLFACLYRKLSPAADAHVARSFVTAVGPLAIATAATDRRLTSLSKQSV